MEKKGRFFYFLDRAADLTILGFLWLVTSIPLVTVGTASAALYYAASKSVRFGEGKPVKAYFKSFKENWREGLYDNA